MADTEPTVGILVRITGPESNRVVNVAPGQVVTMRGDEDCQVLATVTREPAEPRNGIEVIVREYDAYGRTGEAKRFVSYETPRPRFEVCRAAGDAWAELDRG